MIIHVVTLFACLNEATTDRIMNPELGKIITYTKHSLSEYTGTSRCTNDDEIVLGKFYKLEGNQGDTILRDFLPYYTDFLSHASRCPELVKASILLLVNHELGRLLLAGEYVSLTTEAGMRLLDLYTTYSLYKYWTSGDENSARFVFWEDEMRSRFQRLWRNVYGRESYCQCVEGYDFFSSMDTTAKSLFRRPDFISEVMNPSSYVHKIIRRDRMCQSDGGGMPSFNVLAINSDCVAAMTTFNILCASNFALQGRLNVTLNLAEAAVHGLTLAAHCVDEEVWAIERAEAVSAYFAKVAWSWPPTETVNTNLTKFVFRSQPAGEVWELKTPVCEWLFKDVGIFGGALVTGNLEVNQVSVCTETFTTPVLVKQWVSDAAASDADTGSRRECKQSGRYGLVVHNAVFGLNLWHDMHWMVKVFRQKRQLRKLFGDKEVDVVVAASISSQNAFGQLKPWHSAETRNYSMAEVEPWRKLHEPWLRKFMNVGEVLSLNDAEGRCYEQLLWGAPGVRFDRELRRTIRRGEVKKAWEEMREVAGNTTNVGKILIIQRPVYKGRILVNAEELGSRLNAPVITPTANMTILEQIALVQDARVIIGPHGAALALMAFMRRPALVLELIAKEVPDELLHCPDRVDGSPHGMYGGLARLFGVHHACIRSWTSASPKPIQLQDLTVWRKIDITADVDRIAGIVHSFLTQYP